MGADLGSAQARKVTFRLIGRDAAIHVALGMIHAESFVPDVETLPRVTLVRDQHRIMLDVIEDDRRASRFVRSDESERPPATFAHDDDRLALAVEVLQQAAILAVRLLVRGLHVSAEIGSIDLDGAREFPGREFNRHRFAQFVGEDERGLVLHAEIAAQVKRRHALRAVDEDHDRGEQRREGQLATGEDRARRDAELVMARHALEPATGRDVVSLCTPALRANGATIGVGPAQLPEVFVSAVFPIRNTVASDSDRASVERRKCCANTTT